MIQYKMHIYITRILRKGGRLVLTTPNKHYHSLFGDRVSEIEDGGHVRKGYALTDLKNICERSDLEIIEVEYLSGFFTQKLIDLERRVARALGGALAAVALYPFRPLSRFDRFVEFEPLCIAIVAEKRWRETGGPLGMRIEMCLNLYSMMLI